jgi:tetratricopeptide (TPR) repeat protein
MQRVKVNRAIFILTLSMSILSCSGLLGPKIGPGLDLSEAGDHGGALAYYESIIDENKANAKVYRLAYESAFRAGKRTTAAQYYDNALNAGFKADSLKSLAIELWYERALWVMGAQRWKDARAAGEAIANLDPGSIEDKYCRLILQGKSKFDQGSHKSLWDAVSDYHDAANLNPNSGLPYFLMGQARYKNNRSDYDAALEDYYRALEIEPNGSFSAEAKADIEKIESVKNKMKNF